MTTYPYIGPEEIRSAADGKKTGTIISSPEDLKNWINLLIA